MNDLRDHELRILVGVTGASGSVYAERLIDVLRKKVGRIYLVATDAGQKVIRHELRAHANAFSLVNAIDGVLSDEDRSVIRLCRNEDLFAPVASGSSAPTAMVIAPCSMGTLGRINAGISGNLLERAADVVLKQKRPLILCPRETPLSTIHLRNMLSLSEMGAHIVPPMPAFYHAPKDMADMVDFVVGRLLEALGIEHDLYPAWNVRMR